MTLVRSCGYPSTFYSITVQLSSSQTAIYNMNVVI